MSAMTATLRMGAACHTLHVQWPGMTTCVHMLNLQAMLDPYMLKLMALPGSQEWLNVTHAMHMRQTGDAHLQERKPC
jgi:hypothetical protein